jgi:hypothetical protein
MQLNCIFISALKFEVKVKGHPRTGRDAQTERENSYSSAHSLTLCLRWVVGGPRHASAALPTLETQYPFLMKLKIWGVILTQNVGDLLQDNTVSLPKIHKYASSRTWGSHLIMPVKFKKQVHLKLFRFNNIINSHSYVEQRTAFSLKQLVPLKELGPEVLS